jgi:ornithine carbamoyltransferase
MTPPLDRLPSAFPLPAEEGRAVVARARTLKQAAAAGIPQPLRRGKHLALVCADPHCSAAEAFAVAAEGLGARVSRLQPDAVLLAGDDRVAAPGARMLGRLYDAVECDELPPEAAQRLQKASGVPVFCGLARDDHPLQALRPALDGHACGDDTDNGLYLVQAWLVHTLLA